MKFLGLGGRRAASVGRDGLPSKGNILSELAGTSRRQRELANMRKNQFYESARGIKKTMNERKIETHKNFRRQKVEVYKKINNPNPGRQELQLYAQYGVKPAEVYSHPERARAKVIKKFEDEVRRNTREISAEKSRQLHLASRNAAKQVRKQLQANNDQAA